MFLRWMLSKFLYLSRNDDKNRMFWNVVYKSYFLIICLICLFYKYLKNYDEVFMCFVFSNSILMFELKIICYFLVWWDEGYRLIYLSLIFEFIIVYLDLFFFFSFDLVLFINGDILLCFFSCK